MEVKGTVVGWRDGTAMVQIAAGACSDCEQDCPARAMARPGVLLADAPRPLRPGQSVQVDVSLPPHGKAVFMAFLLPLAGFLMGLFLGNYRYAGAPLPALGLALAGAALAYGGVAVAERRHRSRVMAAVTPLTGQTSGVGPVQVLHYAERGRRFV